MKQTTVATSSFSFYGAGLSSLMSSAPLAKLPPSDDRDTEALAGFLLSLKHRSVTPEPSSSSSDSVMALTETSSQASSCARTPSPFMESLDNSKLSKQQASASSSRSTSTSSSSSSKSKSNNSVPLTDESIEELLSIEVDVEGLLGDSKLVCMEDRDLVPDALFAAMAQMKPCRLQHADRVGCYKNRDLGFIGMCCMHCGGQPGFGRYYPNSVRSLAQTTTSQTILKHIGGKCRLCPEPIREAILLLQKQQAAREGLPTGRPRYGSRKIFFQRVWQRLHGTEVEQELEQVLEENEAQAAVATTSATVDKNAGIVSSSDEASLQSEGDDEVAMLVNAGGKRKHLVHQEDSSKRHKVDLLTSV